MATVQAPEPRPTSFTTRLSRLTPLAAPELAILQDAERDQRRTPARRELIGEGQQIRERRALVSGWACRQRILKDGQRQVLSFLLPGDLIGVCRHSNPIALTTILAIHEVTTCAAPHPETSGLAEAYARSAALEEHHFIAQIIRLGRLNAYERLADWLLETSDRLALVDLAAEDRFALPITQEMLADALGLTSVHVNRTLQAMRRDGLVHLQGGMISLPDRGRLVRLVDYKPARVCFKD